MNMIETNTPEKIHRAISSKISNGVTYIDALIEYAKEQNVEIEFVAEIVKRSPIIKEKIKDEAIKNKLIKVDENALNQLYE